MRSLSNVRLNPPPKADVIRSPADISADVGKTDWLLMPHKSFEAARIRRLLVAGCYEPRSVICAKEAM